MFMVDFEIYEDRFEVGDKVTWRDERWARHNDGKRRYGDGPFKVTAVEDVSDHQKGGVCHTQLIRVKMGVFSGAYFRKAEPNG